MDLNLTEHQNMLRDAMRDFRIRDYPRDVLVAVDAGHEGLQERWARLAATGVLGSLVPESMGGIGASLTDAAVMYEELGRGPVPGPHFSSGVLAASVVLEGGTPAQQAALLPSLVTGERVFAVAVTEADYGWGPEFVRVTAVRRDDGYVLSGTKLFVRDAELATDLIVAVRLESGRLGLLIVEVTAPGIAVRPLHGFVTGLSEVTLEEVSLPESALLGGGREDGWAVLDRVFQKAVAVLAAYQVGGLAEVCEMTLDYTRKRHQFQQPIGRFQRVQDHVIDMVNHLDAARWTTYEALWKLDTGRPAAASVHTAAVVATEGYYLGCNAAHDVHAGVGIMRDYGLTLHTKMSRTLYHYLGGPRHHREQLAGALGL